MKAPKKVWDDRAIYVTEAGGEDTIEIRLASGRSAKVESSIEHLPLGLQACTAHVGVAQDPQVLDFSVVRLPRPATAAAVYTRNLCVSPAIDFDRENTRRGLIQLVCVISKNANVFTPTGRDDVESVARALSQEFEVDGAQIFLSCTGVIGRSLPMPAILGNVPGRARDLAGDQMDAVSRAIMTTDKRPKCASVRIGDVVIGGYAKGAGMIEPNMATMLVYLFTNAIVDKPELDRALKAAVDRTFNALSVDSDTSTSDSVLLLATGDHALGRDELDAFELGLTAVCLKLARAVAREAEGATKLLEVTVRLATSAADAHHVAKKIVNSPLIKTAVHGADPNWGRVVMAIGKPSPGSPLMTIDPAHVTIRILGQLLYDRGRELGADLRALSLAMKAATSVEIEVDIGAPYHAATVWGCDLSNEYVEENAHYTT
jgi:glutamate N-acetyltransferase/amino-acid N-acetyltransferase